MRGGNLGLMFRREGLTYLRVRLRMKDQEGLGEAFSKEPLHCLLGQSLEYIIYIFQEAKGCLFQV